MWQAWGFRVAVNHRPAPGRRQTSWLTATTVVFRCREHNSFGWRHFRYLLLVSRIVFRTFLMCMRTYRKMRCILSTILKCFTNYILDKYFYLIHLFDGVEILPAIPAKTHSRRQILECIMPKLWWIYPTGSGNIWPKKHLQSRDSNSVSWSLLQEM